MKSIQKPNRSVKLFNIVSNGEFFQRQKADLLFKVLEPELNKNINLGYVCVGSVKAEQLDSLSALFHYELRDKYFRYSAEQRQMIGDKDLIQSKIESLTLFSIIYDLFGINHQLDIKKLPTINVANICDNDNTLKFSEQSSFVLYNCARLSAILEKFRTRVKQGKSCCI